MLWWVMGGGICERWTLLLGPTDPRDPDRDWAGVADEWMWGQAVVTVSYAGCLIPVQPQRVLFGSYHSTGWNLPGSGEFYQWQGRKEHK